MATKMNAEIAKRVKSLGINAADEEAARKELLAILTKNDIDGMEEEDTITLVEIAESFVETSPVEEDEEEPAKGAETEEELDQLADENANEPEPEEEEEVEEESEDAETDEFDAMDRKALKAYISENELEISVKKSMSDDDIRARIREAIAGANETAAPEPTAAKPEKAESKAKKEPKAKKENSRGTKLDPKNNEEDRTHFDALKELFPEDEFGYDWVSSNGVTIKHKGKNSSHAICGIEGCTLLADGNIKCTLYFLSMKKNKEVLDNMDLDYQESWSGSPFIRGLNLTEAIELLAQVKDTCVSTVSKSDKHLGDNREKMEENLAKGGKKAKK